MSRVIPADLLPVEFHGGDRFRDRRARVGVAPRVAPRRCVLVVDADLERVLVAGPRMDERRRRQPRWRDSGRNRAKQPRQQRRAGVRRYALSEDEVKPAQVREREIVGRVERGAFDSEDVASELMVDRLVDQPPVGGPRRCSRRAPGS